MNYNTDRRPSTIVRRKSGQTDKCRYIISEFRNDIIGLLLQLDRMDDKVCCLWSPYSYRSAPQGTQLQHHPYLNPPPPRWSSRASVCHVSGVWNSGLVRWFSCNFIDKQSPIPLDKTTKISHHTFPFRGSFRSNSVTFFDPSR